MKSRAILAAALGAVILAGCGDGSTSLSGSVTLDGQPLQQGFILFHGPNGEFLSEGIRAGRYDARNPPLGDVTIVLSDGAPPLLIDGKPDLKNVRPGLIPSNYLTKESSPLKAHIRTGRNRFDVVLVSPK